MPVQKREVLRYQGNARIILRRVLKVAKQSQDWNTRYADVDRKKFNPLMVSGLTAAASLAEEMLAEKIEV